MKKKPFISQVQQLTLLILSQAYILVKYYPDVKVALILQDKGQTLMTQNRILGSHHMVLDLGEIVEGHNANRSYLISVNIKATRVKRLKTTRNICNQNNNALLRGCIHRFNIDMLPK